MHGKVLKFQKKILKFREIGVFLKKSVGIQSGPSRDPVGTQSGPNRAPIFEFLGTAFGQSGSSRDPIFEFLAPRLDLSGSSQNHPKTRKTTPKMLFFMNLAASRHWCPTRSRLDPDWPKAVPKKCKNWCPTGSRQDPDEIPTGSIDRQEPSPGPAFPFPDPPLPLFSFSAHQPCTNTPPLLHQNGKSSLKPNGGSTNVITSPRHHIVTSPSPHHHITTPPHYLVTTSSSCRV